jgi:DnaJ-class molecular chaperone
MAVNVSRPGPCPLCGGRGRVTLKTPTGEVKDKVCPRCHGTKVDRPAGAWTK